MNFLCKQAFTTNFGQTPILHLITRGVNLVFLKRAHIPQNGAEACQCGKEGARLHQREGRTPRANTQRQGAAPRMATCLFLAGRRFRRKFLQRRRRGG